MAIQFEENHKGEDLPNPYSLDYVAKLKKEYDADPEAARLSDKTLFYFFDGLLGTKISQSVHPAGIVISPITLDDNYGTFMKDGEICLCLDMENIHDFTGVVKYDLLILRTVQILKETCEYVGVPYPHMWDVDFNDMEVWQDMWSSLSMIFQFESSFASDCFKRMRPTSIEEMSLVTACVRPSGTSYRDDLLARKPHKNPSEMIDELLNDQMGYLVYQEDTLKFLQNICGLSGEESDNIRRAIGRKQKDRLDAAMPDILEGYCRKSDKPREEAENEAKEFLKIIEDSAAYQFNYSHAVAYCLVGFLCGYYRHYYPLEFVTSYLNNAANDEDILVGTEYAKRVGIRIEMPKWGISRGNYFYDKEQRTIAKGLSSIKFIGDSVSEELYTISHERTYGGFMEVLYALSNETSIDTRQVDILVKIDYFSEFGNQRELLYLVDVFYNLLKKGTAKQIRKTKLEDSPLAGIIEKYSTGVTKSGSAAASYTILDMQSIMMEIENRIKTLDMPDLSDQEKMKNFSDVMGYAGYTSGKEEDRNKLLVRDVKPLVRKKDGKQFGYSIFTRSVGSGIESRFTVFNKIYDDKPIKKDDFIRCTKWSRDGQYFRMEKYTII